MKLAYITTYDAKDIREWSGNGWHIAQALQAQGCELDYIGNLRKKHRFWLGLLKLYYGSVHNLDLHLIRHPLVIKNFASQIKARLIDPSPDVLFSPGSIPLGGLDHKRPMVFWTDSTFNGLVDYYPEFQRLSKHALAHGEAIERKALQNCALAIYSSRWAADHAIAHYDVDPSKVKVVPFGANMKGLGSTSEALSVVQNRSMNKCELLFIGVDWTRKGGDLAMSLAEELEAAGRPVRLTIIGCKVPKNVKGSPLTDVKGFVGKDLAKGLSTLEACFRRAHFLVVPSLAECYGLVYCEANAYAVPCLARNTGGVTEVIKNGVNGMTFETDANASEYRDLILSYMADRGKYNELAMNAYNEFRTRLNWNVAGKRVVDFMEDLLEK